MKRPITGLLAMALFATTSCSDNDNPEPEIKDEYIITGWDMKYSGEDDSTFFRFTYNADGTVKQTKEWDKTDADTEISFTYSTYLDGKIVKNEYQYGVNGQRATEFSYFYKDGRLARINHHDGTSDVPYSYDTLYYNAAGKIVELRSIYRDAQMAQWNNKKYLLSWNGNNISKVEHYGINNGDGILKLLRTEVYTVDNKPNVFGNIVKDQFLWKTDPHNFEYINENNVIKVEETEAGTTTKYVRTSTYTYNEQSGIAKFKSVSESFVGGTLDDSYFVEAVIKYEKK